jgi:hypothetical protein
MSEPPTPPAVQTAAKPPIVYRCLGMKPDVCLNVLGQDYHAHSILLKLLSAFFWTFLDSADKETSVMQASEAKLTSKFRDERVTKVDEDGSFAYYLSFFNASGMLRYISDEVENFGHGNLRHQSLISSAGTFGSLCGKERT